MSRNRLDELLPDHTPTNADQPLEIFVPTDMLLGLLETSINSINMLRSKMDAEDGNRVHTDAILRQREQLRERIRAMQASGSEQVYMAMYPTSPYQTLSPEEFESKLQEAADCDTLPHDWIKDDDEDDTPTF